MFRPMAIPPALASRETVVDGEPLVHLGSVVPTVNPLIVAVLM
jgi:hypothetical protein